MSFDIPLHIPENSLEAQVIEAIVSRDHVSPAEAVLTAIRGMASKAVKTRPAAKKDKSKEVAPLSDEELAALDEMCPALKALDDVTDEQWDNVLKGARRMNREGFPNRV